jgi:putative peptidoglycan lipid II flippase
LSIGVSRGLRLANAGAAESQRRAFELTLLATVPFVAAFVSVPDVIVRAMFTRGAFTSAVATLYARKDTVTPVKASLTA